MYKSSTTLDVPASLTVKSSGAVAPPPAGVAHVASPRQNVVLLALVPLFKFATGRFPVTPLDKSTCAHEGLLVVPVLDKYLVAVVFLARWFHVPVAEMYGTSPCAHVDEFCPVPPLELAN